MPGSRPPKIRPKPVAEWDASIAALAGDPNSPGGGTLNVFGTLANHPQLLKRWLVFGNHVLFKNSLSDRARELVILRTGWNCSSPYEWGQHIVIGRAVGITDDEVRAIADGPNAPSWADPERALLQAADELHTHSCIADATWSLLVEHLDDEQLLDLVFTVGQYHLVAMALNSCRVERDDGVDAASLPFPVHPDEQ